jgi:hypothetical protein
VQLVARSATGATGPKAARKETKTVALSDQLNNLATRAKQLEKRAAAARQKDKAELETDVIKAQQSAEARGDALRARAQADKGRISAWSDNLQASWNDHLKAVRITTDERRAVHDLKSAQRAAQQADDDAEFAIDYAYAAIEEAEYAVLDAELAHLEAEELAQD